MQIRIALLALINPHNQILMCLRRADTPDFPNMWELPGGGIDAGETPKEAAIRESYEELQLIVSPDTCTFFGLYHGEHRGKPVELHIFRTPYPTAINPVFGEGQQAWRWMDQSDIWNFPHIPGNKAILVDLLSNLTV